MTGFFVFMSLQDIAPESSWLEEVPLKDDKTKWKINVRKMKTKLYLETLWTMGSRIHGEGTIQIPQSSSATIDPLAL